MQSKARKGALLGRKGGGRRLSRPPLGTGFMVLFEHPGNCSTAADSPPEAVEMSGWRTGTEPWVLSEVSKMSKENAVAQRTASP